MPRFSGQPGPTAGLAKCSAADGDANWARSSTDSDRYLTRVPAAGDLAAWEPTQNQGSFKGEIAMNNWRTPKAIESYCKKLVPTRM